METGIISSMFYYLGLVLVLFSWVCGAYLLVRWHDQGSATISKHAASTGASYLLFVSTLVGIGSLFFAWAFRYLVPQSSAPMVLRFLLALGFLLQTVTATVPDRPGWQRTVHQYGAWGMAISWLPLTFLIGLSVCALRYGALHMHRPAHTNANHVHDAAIRQS